MEEIYDVMILGAGAAGLTAGIYSSRAKLKTIILNEGAIGGQMVLTNEIANYPGVELTKGYSLAATMKKQAKDFGCKIKSNVKIANLQLKETIKTVELEDGRSFQAKSVIIAPGGKPRSLDIEGEEKFKGTGISFCATCDGEFFTDKEVIVVGGGNSALEEAVSLSKYATKITIVHQFDHFQAFEHAIRDAKNNEKISFILESELRGFYGTDGLEKVSIEHLPTGKIAEMKTDGVFIFAGYQPNTQAFEQIIKLNDRKEILVDEDMKTNIAGVFAAGDCIAKKYRQVTTAVADGTIAGLSAANYIQNFKNQ
ncbi:MAG: FAD-dependent oxidoreductase [Bacteroidetes bacterium]|jgi:thioredoxin reductase (NADPH)|nr:FAD-dependent oxidoreductase [Bacteroidota bacterium]MBT6687439.1 FAD-dependent oxidoreductase [Bacteroidota bacterium]MBT7143369.1 FAD-dependent oxidoreductase [Bacteroidota bacterium]MBT7491633.1 FAD-dependent oxidoreductase [Bacteroidota bacterium]